MQKLYCVCTRQQYSASLDYFVIILPPYLHQFATISGGNCIRLTVSLFDSQANQSNQSSIQRELLMPSPEVIDLTLSDNEIQPDPIRSNQGTSTPTRARNCFGTSSSTPLTSGINRTQRILPVIQRTFAANRLTVSSFDSQANQSNQSSIQRELLMPSPEVIDLTLSDNEIHPDPIRSNQGTSMPT